MAEETKPETKPEVKPEAKPAAGSDPSAPIVMGNAADDRPGLKADPGKSDAGKADHGKSDADRPAQSSRAPKSNAPPVSASNANARLAQNMVLTGRYHEVDSKGGKTGKCVEVVRVDGQQAGTPPDAPKRVHFHEVDADRRKAVEASTGKGAKSHAPKVGKDGKVEDVAPGCETMSLADFLAPADPESGNLSPKWVHENPPPADTSFFAPL